MARRFTDSEKWKDPWFGELKTELKILWVYLLDNCDHSGIWKVNKRTAEFEMGLSPGWGERPGSVPKEFDGRVDVNGEYWFIPKFLKWQYGEKLNKGDAFLSALERIESKGFLASLERLMGGSVHPLGRVKAKAKAKAQAKALNKEGGVGETKSRPKDAAEVTSYAASIGFELDGQYFIDSYEKGGWVYGKGRIPVRDWKACVRTWKKNNFEMNGSQKLKPEKVLV